MLYKNTYVEKQDLIILLLFVVAYSVSSYFALQLTEGILGSLALHALFFFFFALYVSYMYRRHLAYQVYDKSVKDNYRQTEALFNLFSMFKFDYPLPPMRHWAVSPDALLYLIRQTILDRPAIIVECGSGVSTIVLAKCLKEQKINAHIYSLDHDPSYANKTEQALRLHGVEEYATIITAPLSDVDVNGKRYQWYDKNQLQKIPDGINLIFVDGPPAPQGSFNRYPALFLLKEKMDLGCRIMMDDVIRSDEERISRMWADDLGRKDVEYLDVEKKMALI